MVASICATFITGPLRLPNANFRSAGISCFPRFNPKYRWPATRAAIPPTAPVTFAYRFNRPDSELFSVSSIRYKIG